MTTLELAKIVRDSRCEINIAPSEVCNAVYITAKNKDKVFKSAFSMESAFSDLEETFDYIIKMGVYQVKD